MRIKSTDKKNSHRNYNNPPRPKNTIFTFSYLFFLLIFFGMCQVVHADVNVSGTISSNTTWTVENSPYHITGDVTVNNGVTLTLEPGVIVKFQYVSHGYSKLRMLVYGTLTAQGTAGSPIIFTSEFDDVYGGDTNGDGGGSTPNNGDWGHVRIMNTGSATIEYCRFWYGGYRDPSEHQMLWIQNPNVAVRRCEFRRAASIAHFMDIAGFAGAVPVVSANVVENCPIGLKYDGGSSGNALGRITGNIYSNCTTAVQVTRVGGILNVMHNQFNGITSFGVQNTDPSRTVDARYNWWGHVSGPSGQWTGLGCQVSQYVIFSGGWTSPSQSTDGVWNILAQRRGDSMLMDVYYDLVATAGTTYEVDMTVSDTGGAPYSLTSSSSGISGAVGSGVSPGSGLHILWDSAASGGGPYTDTMRVKVTANLE
jgi:hypothetical protein